MKNICKYIDKPYCVNHNPSQKQCEECKIPDIYEGKGETTIKPKTLTASDVFCYFLENSSTFGDLDTEVQDELIEVVLELQKKTQKNT